jgi:hypothetical protein
MMLKYGRGGSRLILFLFKDHVDYIEENKKLFMQTDKETTSHLTYILKKIIFYEYMNFQNIITTPIRKNGLSSLLSFKR